MGLAVVTVAAGGLPVVESTAGGIPVTEATNGRGIAVTKVPGKPGLPVIYVADAGGAVTPTADHIVSLSASISGNSHTFSGVATGAAHAKKMVVVAVASKSATAGHFQSGMTINGVTATLDAVSHWFGDSGAASVFHAPMSGGGTADIVITFPHTTTAVAISVFRLVGLYPFGPGRAYVNLATTGTAYADVQNGGLLIAAMAVRDAAATATLTGTTDDANATVNGMRYVFAHSSIGANAAGYPVGISLNMTSTALLCLSSWRTTAPPGRAQWQPDEEGSLRLWYKMDALAGSNGSNVASVPDATGNFLSAGYAATQATGADQPRLAVAAINGLNTLRFNVANTEFLNLPAGALNKWCEGTVFAVLKKVAENSDASATGSGVMMLGTAAQANVYGYSDGHMYMGNLGDQRPDHGDPAAPLINAHIWCERINVYASYQSWINGVLLFGTSVQPSGSAAPTLGSTPGQYFDGWVAEMIVFRRAVDVATRQKTEGYLAHKWGLTAGLDSGHPYKSTPP